MYAWLADLEAATQHVGEATDWIIAQNERRERCAPLDGDNFMPAVRDLLATFLELAEVAGSIVQARLTQAMQEALLLQMALAADRPQA